MTDSVFNDRRSFLKAMGVAAGAAGVAGAAGTPVLLSASPAAAAAEPRGTDVQGWGLELGETFVPSGVMSKAQGGWPSYEVVEEEGEGDGEGAAGRKHIGAVKYEDISIAAGPGMSSDFYALIESMLQNEGRFHMGAIVSLTTNIMTHSRLSFENALITEVGFPALDGASKDAAKFTVKLSPERTAFHHVQEKWQPSAKQQQKKWLVSNFKLEIDGLDCSKVSKIDAFTVKQKVVESPDGTVAPAAKEPAKIEFPNVVITMPDVASPQFFKWWENALGAEGNDEKQGKITWLSADLKTPIGSLTLTNLGPVRVAHEADGATGESIRRFTAEMYCEQMSLKFDAAT